MKLYNKKRSGKKNPGFECENEIQSSGTVENLTTGCQSETCEQSTTKETKKGNRKNMDDVIKRFHNMVSRAHYISVAVVTSCGINTVFPLLTK